MLSLNPHSSTEYLPYQDGSKVTQIMTLQIQVLFFVLLTTCTSTWFHSLDRNAQAWQVFYFRWQLVMAGKVVTVLCVLSVDRSETVAAFLIKFCIQK